MKLRIDRLVTYLGIVAVWALSASLVSAQTADRPMNIAEVDEEIIATGTYIQGLRQEDLASPLLSIDRTAISSTGAISIADVVNNLTINTGSENNPDAFTQNFTTGTSNINLRGLGVASTLVLLNSRRQTYSAFANNNGENFVDTSSLVPMIAVERIEILKDGATSLYGSDAVAGVVNFITRKNFEGFELEVEAQYGVDDQENYNLGGIYGVGNDNSHFIAAFNYLNRAGVGTHQRRLSTVADDSSRAGFPGTFLVPTLPSFPAFADDPMEQALLIGTWQAAFDSAGNIPGLADFFEPLVPGGTPIPNAQQPAFADFDCTNLAAVDDTTLPPDTFPVGVCGFDFGTFASIVPEEDNLQLYASFDHNFNDKLSLFVELGYTTFTAKRRASPSFPITSTPLVCGDGSLDSLLDSSCAALGAHPDNPYGVDVLFVGRTLGSGADAETTVFDSDTSRFVTGFSGELNNNWEWTADFTHSKNDNEMETNDTLATEFQNALIGLGGDECIGEPFVDIFPGVGPCAYFNPFGSSLTGTGTTNTADIIDYITGRLMIKSTAELNTVSGVFNGPIAELANGTAYLAVGAQFRNEKLEYDYDENSNNNNFLFTVGNPDFNTERDIGAAFAELSTPITQTLELQFSLRYEDYEDSGDSTNPKLALLWRPNEQVSLRTTFTTSFRAPSLFQQNGIRVTLEEIVTPTLGRQFLPVRAQPNPDSTLKPEEADIFNLGVSWQDNRGGFELSSDYWSYDYDNAIIQQNPQAILNAALAGSAEAAEQVVFSAGTISQINVFYANASSLKTDGVDLTAAYNWNNTSTGQYRIGLELTRVFSYDIDDPQAGKIDGLGQRNFENFATSMPELRANLHFFWGLQQHSVNAYLRHIDSYNNDQLDANGVPLNEKIAAHTTLDLQYNYLFGPIGKADDGILLSVGALNATDEKPPKVSTNSGYDSKVHDPRGVRYYIKATIPF